MSGYHNYDRHPVIAMPRPESTCSEGWTEVLLKLRGEIPEGRRFTVAFECYPGVRLDLLSRLLQEEFGDADVINVEEAYRGNRDLRDEFAATLTSDPVFGVMHGWRITDFFEEAKLEELRAKINGTHLLTIVLGAGTRDVLPEPDLLLHASVTRWELQRRQRAAEIGNLGVDNVGASPALLYKNAFFLDWRVGDEIRHEIYRTVDFFLDLNEQETPRMLRGDHLRQSVSATVQRPFRVVPFFDPGPWGGHWMKETFDLPEGPPNYAWCFDCVPEENSITLGFGARRFQLPAITLVHEEPLALLGEAVHRRFGAEFPIRFDLLDTVGGGNLSLQVHPLTAYIRKHFGMTYTQDESYYILDSRAGSHLYLGLRDGVRPEQMRVALEAAQAGARPFPAEEFVNVWPTRTHDHFSIPAGTVHCSGNDNLVLEISATPYIFTFKLWDWGRVGLDGRPRPIHLEHGLANIQWERDTAWVRRELIDQVEPMGEGKGWREERTGLHGTEFLETRRTWFTEAVTHNTEGNLNVLNLVEGEAVSVESPDGAFLPMEIHYAETFIIPASVGPYIVRPLGSSKQPMATIKAYLRPDTDLGSRD